MEQNLLQGVEMKQSIEMIKESICRLVIFIVSFFGKVQTAIYLKVESKCCNCNTTVLAAHV